LHWTGSLPLCIDKLEDLRLLSISENNFRKILKSHLARLLQYQNAYWKRRCTIRWTKFGDENSKLFETIATERHRRNSIASISLPYGTTITEHADKEHIIYQTYKERLGSCSTPQMQFDLASLITPTPGLEELSAPFTKEEIDEVVKHMPPDKAPGPDGFTGLFLKCCWDTIKEDIYDLCFQFYEGNLDLESINMGHITLIPKVATPVGVNDYRPITLINCVLIFLPNYWPIDCRKLFLKLFTRINMAFLGAGQFKTVLHGNLNSYINVKNQIRRSFYSNLILPKPLIVLIIQL
jgi:hypothetical protein